MVSLACLYKPCLLHVLSQPDVHGQMCFYVPLIYKWQHHADLQRQLTDLARGSWLQKQA